MTEEFREIWILNDCKHLHYSWVRGNTGPRAHWEGGAYGNMTSCVIFSHFLVSILIGKTKTPKKQHVDVIFPGVRSDHMFNGCKQVLQ